MSNEKAKKTRFLSSLSFLPHAGPYNVTFQTLSAVPVVRQVTCVASSVRRRPSWFHWRSVWGRKRGPEWNVIDGQRKMSPLSTNNAAAADAAAALPSPSVSLLPTGNLLRIFSSKLPLARLTHHPDTCTLDDMASLISTDFLTNS